MSPDHVNAVASQISEYPATQTQQEILALVEHLRELQAFVVDLTDHLAKPGPTPEKTAEYYQVSRRAHALRQKIQPSI